MNNKQKILDKIKKCLRLSASSNEHEAAAALRQAQKLMEEHGINSVDIDMSDIEEAMAKSRAKTNPVGWETVLANKIGKAFGCRVIFKAGFDSGRWTFIGSGADPEVAQYAFAVLLRQATRARTEYIKTRLKRCKTSTKTKRADLFSNGWVMGAVRALHALAGSPEQSTAIDQYIARNYPALVDSESRDRNADRKLRDHELNDFSAGRRSGQDTELNRGVNGRDPQAAIGHQA